VINNFKELILQGEEIYRIKVIVPKVELKKRIEDEVNEISYISACYSMVNLLDCVHVSASKGNALKLLSEQMGIGSDQIAVFGDNYNDISMFRFAGLSIAMGNADGYVQSKALSTTTSNNESGVAYGVKKYVL